MARFRSHRGPSLAGPGRVLSPASPRLLTSAAAALLLAAGSPVSAAPPQQCAGARGAAAPAPRTRILLDAGWKFQLAKTPPAGLGAVGTPVTGWRFQRLPDGASAPDAPPAAIGADWAPAARGADLFQLKSGFAWAAADLGKAPAAGGARTLHFGAVDDNATVFFNGRRLAHHEGWDEPFDVPIPADAWNAAGPNLVFVLIENTANIGGLGDEVRLVDASAAAAPEVLPAEAAPGYKDGGWRSVHLPHDYVVEQPFDPKGNTSHGFLPSPPAWYRKTFTIPASLKGKSLWIDFDGVYRDSVVYLNGHKLGRHPSGYTSFRYDVAPYANVGGRNVLAVSVDPTRGEGWWYEGGGIYRHVWLNAADPVHVAPWGTCVTSTVHGLDPAGKSPAPGAGAGVSADVAVQTKLVNDSPAAQTVRVIAAVFGPDGRPISSSSSDETVPAHGSATISANLPVPKATLWSLEAPALYRLHTVVQRKGEAADVVDTAFGIRTTYWDAARGFFLNGKPVKIKGVCNHQDFAGVGVAVPDHLEAWRVRRLKEMGCNAWRMSHNPPTPELLDACDRLGMLVMDENRHLGDTYRDHTPRGTGYSDLSDLADLIQRDRNHPSVIIWSMCNEEGLQGTDEGAAIFKAMMDVVHKYDTTRPISCAMNGGWGRGISLIEDLQGCNYNPRGYDDFHRQFPNKPIYGSETGSAVGDRGVYADDREAGYVNAYDTQPGGGWAQTAEAAWKPIAEREWMAGGFVWTGFDYRGEPTPYGWPCTNSHFGILDLCGFPKDAYWYYKAWWGDKPSTHVFPHWNWQGKEGQPIKVWVYSNAERVELFLNGKSLGAPQTMPRSGHLEWQVPYAPGTLMARGYDANGRLLSSDKVETTGPPAALRLSADRTRLDADGEDVEPVSVDVVDAEGRVVPTAAVPVSFAVKGAGFVAGVGNGDPSSHEPSKASKRLSFSGRCMAVVGAGEKPGKLTLTATAPGLKPATLEMVAGEAAKP